MAWLRRSRSACSSVRILSSVKGGSSHTVVGLMLTRHSLSPRPIGISDGGRVYTDTFPNPIARFLVASNRWTWHAKVGGSE